MLSPVRWFILFLAIGIGIMLRIPFLPLTGSVLDTHAFIAWSHAIANHGITELYQQTFPQGTLPPNYPPIIPYLLTILTAVCGPLTVVTIKIPGVLSDLIAIGYVWWLTRHATVRWQWFAALGIALNPALILTSAYWGQMDSVYGMFILVALVAISSKKYIASAVLATVALFTKIQTVFVIPLLLALSIITRRSLVRLFVAIGITILIIILPFIFAAHPLDPIRPFFNALGAYPFLTANAMNIWWPFTRGALIPDTIRLLGIPAIYASAIPVTILVAFAIEFLRRRRTLPDIAIASAMTILSFFFFATDMHERYILPALFLIPILGMRYRNTSIITMILLTVSTTANIFYIVPSNVPLLSYILQGLPHFFLVDSWWILNAVALILFIRTMYRGMQTPDPVAV